MNCYAEKMAKRIQLMDRGRGVPEGQGRYDGLLDKHGTWNGKIHTSSDLLEEPLKWRKPQKIFVNSMSDLFHPNVPADFIFDVLRIIDKTHWHTFQVLTKHPDRAVELFGGTSGLGLQAPGMKILWLGVSVESPDYLWRVADLLKVPAGVHWISVEPLLAELHLDAALLGLVQDRDGNIGQAENRIGWVVVGGESGAGARPMHPDWVRDIRDECAEAGVPFFFKQWGEWAPSENARSSPTKTEKTADFFGKKWSFGTLTVKQSQEMHALDEPDLYRFGRRGSYQETLDGIEYKAFPEAV